MEDLIAALRDPDETVLTCAGALGRLGDTRAVELLIATLRDPVGAVRVSIARALGKLGDARAVEPLLAALRDPDKSVRSRVAEALARLGDTRAIEPLITTLQNADTERARDSAAYALEKFPDHPAVQTALADYRASKLPPRTQ